VNRMLKGFWLLLVIVIVNLVITIVGTGYTGALA
jgi:hypothetical protein